MTNFIQCPSIKPAPPAPAAEIAEQPTALNDLTPSISQQNRLQVDVAGMKKPSAKPKLSLISLPEEVLGDMKIADGKLTTTGAFAYLDSDDLVSLACAHRFFREQFPASAELRATKMEYMQTIEKAHSIGNNTGTVRQLSALVPKLYKLNFSNQVAKLIKDIKSIANTIYAPVYMQVLADIATLQAQDGFFADAKATVNMIDLPWQEANALREIASAQAMAGLLADAVVTFAEAKATANTIDDRWRKTLTLRDIAAAQAKADLLADTIVTFAEAKATANTINDFLAKAPALKKIASAEATAELFADAKATANTIDSPQWKAEALREIATAQAQAGLLADAIVTFADAVAAVNMIEDPWFKAQALFDIPKAQADIAAVQANVDFFAEAIKIAKNINVGRYRNEALQYTAAKQKSIGLDSDAERTMQMQDESSCLWNPIKNKDLIYIAVLSFVWSLGKNGRA